MSGNESSAGAMPGGVPAPGGGQLSRVFRMFTEPKAAFRELAVQPRWIVALVVVVAASLLAQLVLAPRLDFETTIRQTMEQRGGQVDEAQLEQAVKGAEKGAAVFRYLSPLVIPLMFLVIAAVYFLGLKVLGSDAPYPAIFATCIHAALPASVVSSLLFAGVAWPRDSLTGQEAETLLKSSLGAWLSPDTAKPLLALAKAVDIFSIWQWVLLVLGFQIVGRVSRGKAVALVAVVWGVWIAGKVLLAVVL